MIAQFLIILAPILDIFVAFINLVEAHPKIFLVLIFVTFVVFFPRGTAYRDPQFRRRH